MTIPIIRDVTTMHTISIFLFSMAFINIAHADIYKCNENGKTIYSQQPCGDKSSNITEKVGVTLDRKYTTPSLSTAPPSKTHEKYQGNLDFTSDSLIENFSKANAVIDIAEIKGRDCEWAIKVSKEFEKCQDFAQFIVEGGRYSQATSYMGSLGKERLAQLPRGELSSTVRSMEKVVTYKQLLVQYFNIE
jgi:hypothetical protein